ncbi:MAG: pilus assembly protein [Bacteroidota bacterium]
MRSTLIDAGPMIALFNRRDQYHLLVVNFLKGFHGRLLTTWPVITEASHMLDFSTTAQINLLEWINRGGLQLIDIEEDKIDRMISLTRKFEDVPMDLADASLIVVSEMMNVREIASIDSDFYVYRDIRNRYLTNVLM